MQLIEGKLYIANFLKDLNNKKIILYIGNVNPKDLKQKLLRDNVSHLKEFTYCKRAGYMYIKNGDVVCPYGIDKVYKTEEEGYTITPLYETNYRYYVRPLDQ